MTTTESTVWDVEAFVRAVDGDTVRLVRRHSQVRDGMEFIERDADPKGAAIRLVWVDTPERGEKGYNEAREDVKAWIAEHGPVLTVTTWGAGGFDRTLGDITDEHGASLSQWLMIERGWPPYVPGR